MPSTLYPGRPSYKSTEVISQKCIPGLKSNKGLLPRTKKQQGMTWAYRQKQANAPAIGKQKYHFARELNRKSCLLLEKYIYFNRLVESRTNVR